MKSLQSVRGSIMTLSSLGLMIVSQDERKMNVERHGAGASHDSKPKNYRVIECQES